MAARAIIKFSEIKVDETEKRWFSCSSKCDLTQLKILSARDSELLNKKDHFTGYAAIHWAAKYGNEDMINWLGKNKANVNIRTNGGYSPLHVATMHKQEAAIRELIEIFDADINIRDYSGRKARHYISGDMSPSIYQALQEKIPAIELTESEPIHQPVSRMRSSSMSSIVNMVAEHGTKSFEEGNFKKKKRKISLNHASFLGRKKNLGVKRVSRSNSFLENNIFKSPSVPDVYCSNPFGNPERRESLILNIKGIDDLTNSAADLINGYAKFINDNKYHRRTSTSPPYTIKENLTWKQKLSQDNEHWETSTYV